MAAGPASDWVGVFAEGFVDDAEEALSGARKKPGADAAKSCSGPSGARTGPRNAATGGR